MNATEKERMDFLVRVTSDPFPPPRVTCSGIRCKQDALLMLLPSVYTQHKRAEMRDGL